MIIYQVQIKILKSFLCLFL